MASKSTHIYFYAVRLYTRSVSFLSLGTVTVTSTLLLLKQTPRCDWFHTIVIGPINYQQTRDNHLALLSTTAVDVGPFDLRLCCKSSWKHAQLTADGGDGSQILDGQLFRKNLRVWFIGVWSGYFCVCYDYCLPVCVAFKIFYLEIVAILIVQVRIILYFVCRYAGSKGYRLTIKSASGSVY